MTKIDLYAPETQEHWYPTYQQLRDDRPVYHVPGTDMYVLTRYDDVMYVLRHVDIFPNGTSQRRSDAAMKIYADHGVRSSGSSTT